MGGWVRKFTTAPDRRRLCVSSLALSCNENDAEHLDRDQPYPSSQKTKRMRTSFKHHQLRTMKSYFAINHNPDAKDLKQLAQKTGLTKRVLQLQLPGELGGGDSRLPRRPLGEGLRAMEDWVT
ncbi:LIM/homeobox protein Lhx2 [Saguinus oedipus]|uniref:LIM/homeobox protein Lhx2 n=1 Tax=Saguinus oedipus TaxID=9490 RepID=A0ABQ9WFS6_SAGOE|nr:LIM/homeobox protein Lhx2 [Saguinus oedipus]